LLILRFYSSNSMEEEDLKPRFDVLIVTLLSIFCSIL
jgi:hypothetical protein